MRFNQDMDLQAYTVRAYAPGEIRVVRAVKASDKSHRIVEEQLCVSFVMTADSLVKNWNVHCVDQLSGEHINSLMEKQPEVILLGTGEHIQFPDRALLQGCYAQGIGIEIMDNAAACRTYNVLVNEGRKVMLAVMLAPAM